MFLTFGVVMVHSSFIAAEGDSSDIEVVRILIGVDISSHFPCDVMMELTWRMLFRL
jgi:hypothetical protein